MTAQEKVAYFKGLMDGMKLDKNSDNAKLFAALADALETTVEELEEVKDDVFDLNEYTEAMDEDLYDVEEELYDDDCDDDYAEFPCPECGEIICLDEDDFCSDTIKCPSCGYEIDFSDECDGGCDCGCEDCK